MQIPYHFLKILVYKNGNNFTNKYIEEQIQLPNSGVSKNKNILYLLWMVLVAWKAYS